MSMEYSTLGGANFIEQKSGNTIISSSSLESGVNNPGGVEFGDLAHITPRHYDPWIWIPQRQYRGPDS